MIWWFKVCPRQSELIDGVRSGRRLPTKPWLVQDVAQLNIADFQLKRLACYAQEIVRRIGENNFQTAGVFRWRTQRLAIQKVLDCHSAISRRIDHHNFVSEKPSECASEQRIMGTAKHECINSINNEWLDISRDDLISKLIVHPALVDETHEEWTRPR